jgi:hypothetical protein
MLNFTKHRSSSGIGIYQNLGSTLVVYRQGRNFLINTSFGRADELNPERK